jgi:hypothetical protein
MIIKLRIYIGPFNSTNYIFRKSLKSTRSAFKSGSAGEASLPPLKISVTQQLVPRCGINIFIIY